MLSRAYFVPSKLQQPAARALAEISSARNTSRAGGESSSRAITRARSRALLAAHKHTTFAFSTESSRVDIELTSFLLRAHLLNLQVSLYLLILPFDFDITRTRKVAASSKNFLWKQMFAD